MISKKQMKKADKVKGMDDLNVRDVSIPKALVCTAKGVDEMSHKVKQQ